MFHLKIILTKGNKFLSKCIMGNRTRAKRSRANRKRVNRTKANRSRVNRRKKNTKAKRRKYGGGSSWNTKAKRRKYGGTETKIETVNWAQKREEAADIAAEARTRREEAAIIFRLEEVVRLAQEGEKAMDNREYAKATTLFNAAAKAVPMGGDEKQRSHFFAQAKEAEKRVREKSGSPRLLV